MDAQIKKNEFRESQFSRIQAEKGSIQGQDRSSPLKSERTKILRLGCHSEA
jgi:hypothetical protein